jgi:P27 family predicted phage terminase small subunit
MRTGRPPKPLELRRLHGNTGHRPLVEVEEFKTRGPLGGPPDFLSPEARAVWERIANVMPRGMIASCDLDLMATYVTAVSLHEQACRELQKTGPVVMGANDIPVISPWCRVQIRQSLLVLRLAAELGFTPASRASMASRLATAAGTGFAMPGERRRSPTSSLDEYLAKKPDRLPDPDEEPN